VARVTINRLSRQQNQTIQIRNVRCKGSSIILTFKGPRDTPPGLPNKPSSNHSDNSLSEPDTPPMIPSLKDGGFDGDGSNDGGSDETPDSNKRKRGSGNLETNERIAKKPKGPKDPHWFYRTKVLPR
jgi:hypothetical protein